MHYDSGELVARPNRAQDAKDAHDRWTISDAALRTATGFSDNDAPDDEELTRRIKIKQAILVRQTIQATPGSVAAEDGNLGNGQDGPGEQSARQ